jgi:hypothetical protein
MKYKLRRSVGVQAEVAGQELARIHENHGALTPEILVQEAEPEDAPMHPAFTWDNDEAGRQFRLLEARNIIRAVHIVDDDGADRGCAYVHVARVDDEHAGAYLPVAEVVSQPQLLAQAIEGLAKKQSEASRALADLEREAKRLGRRKEVSGIGRARKATETAARELGQLT